MIKPSAAKGATLTYPATTAYKQWVWKEIRRRGWTQQKLVDEMKRVGKTELKAIVNPKGQSMYDTISTSTITNLIGPEGESDGPPPPSNCSFMVVLNRALEIAPPPVCDPSSELSQLIDLFRDRWSKITPRERRILIDILRGDDDDAPGMDGDRGGSRAAP